MAKFALTEPLVLLNQQNGIVLVPADTPLTSLNYFDGKFLRAEDLQADKTYFRRLSQLSNQAGGAGVVYGFDLARLAGDRLQLGPGLAIDGDGRVLFMPEETDVSIAELIAQSVKARAGGRREAATAGDPGFAECELVTGDAGVTPIPGVGLYLIGISHAEALCGHEDVYGKLCEEACVTSSQRPYRIEGVVLRALPLALQTPLPTSTAVTLSQIHLRSRVASAYFADEALRIGHLISKAGLGSPVWCIGAAAGGCGFVPLGILARSGSATVFLDDWIARRERIDAQPRRYWQWRMMMRPWDVYLAQILQFQCQLSHLFKRIAVVETADDPCANERGVIREASERVAKLASYYETVTARFTLRPRRDSEDTKAEEPPELEGGLAALRDFHERLQAAGAAISMPSDKVLIDGGIIEVPSAGYLPVMPDSVASVNQQVRRLMGRGVDLRFCIVRPDFVAHALEEAQHMQRISLLEGLDRPDRRPEVDVLVPNGEAIDQRPLAGVAYEAEVRIADPATRSPTRSATPQAVVPMRGAAHIEVPELGPIQLLVAADRDKSGLSEKARLTGQSLWAAVTCSLNPFAAPSGGRAFLDLSIALASAESGKVSLSQDLRLNGTTSFAAPVNGGTQRTVRGQFDGMFSLLGKSPVNIPRLSLELTAVLSAPNGPAPSLQLTLRNPAAGLAIEVSASWSGSPRRVALTLKTTTDAGDKTSSGMLIDATFPQNDDVLLPQNSLHVAALAALDMLGEALGDPQFPPRSAAMLFPPPPTPTEDLQIRAVLDWVLFHRRRTKRCQPETPAVVIPARRYRLWHGRVKNQDFLKKTTDELEAKDHKVFDRNGVEFRDVDAVEFAPGVPTLITSAEAIRADWSKVKPGPVLLYAGIASRDAAKQEGDSLAEGRLGVVVAAVSAISVPDKKAFSTVVLPEIHPALAVPDTDGSIVLLTMPQTTCVTVMSVKEKDELGRIAKAIADGSIEKVLASSSLIEETGVVHFTEDKANPADLDDLIKSWDNLKKVPDSEAILGLQSDDARIKASLARQQSKAILAALPPQDIPPPELKVVESPKPLPTECPVVLFVLATRKE